MLKPVLAICQILVDRQRDFAVGGESPDLLLAEDQFAVERHVEDTSTAGGEFACDFVLAVFLRQFGHQTGGLGQVVSLLAVGNVNLHCVPPCDAWLRTAELGVQRARPIGRAALTA